MGDSVAAVALPWLVYTDTHSALATGLVLALYRLPYVVLGVFAGVIVDRFNRRSLMVGADIVRAGLVLAVPAVAQLSHPAVYVLAFAAACFTVVFDPARLAIVPEILAADQLLRANSLLATAENVTEVIGYAFAGLLVTLFSTTTAFRLDAVTFLVSAVALSFIVYRPAGPRHSASTTSVLHQVMEGLRYLVNHRGLFANSVMSIGAAAGAGATYPLTFLFAVRVLHGGPRAFSLLEAVLGLGFLLGSLAVASAAGRVKKGVAMIAGYAVTGLGFLAFGLLTSTWLAATVLLIVGVANATALIATDTFVQQTVPDHLRGRIWGSRFTLTQGTYALSALCAGALAMVLDLQVLFAIAGVLIIVPALAGSLVREIRRA